MAKQITITRTLSIVFLVSIVSYALSLYEFVPIFYWLRGEKVQGMVAGYQSDLIDARSKVVNAGGGKRTAVIIFKDMWGKQYDYWGADIPILPFYHYELAATVTIVYPKNAPEKARILGLDTILRSLYFFILGQMAWTTFKQKNII